MIQLFNVESNVNIEAMFAEKKGWRNQANAVLR